MTASPFTSFSIVRRFRSGGYQRLAGPATEFRPWNWETSIAPYFDPTGRFLAYLRQRAPGAPQSVTEQTVIHDIATQEERVWPEPH